MQFTSVFGNQIFVLRFYSLLLKKSTWNFKYNLSVSLSFDYCLFFSSQFLLFEKSTGYDRTHETRIPSTTDNMHSISFPTLQ